MKKFLLLPLLLMFVSPVQNSAPNGSAVVVLDFKWYKSRQVVEQLDNGAVSPAPAMIPGNKIAQRNDRVNKPGSIDPNESTIDGRSAAIDKAVHAAESPNKPVEGFAYRAKVKNASKGVIEIVFWEYQFIDKSDPAIVTRRQFLCGVNIKPDKERELQAFSVSGPSSVVSVGSLGNKSGNDLQEKVVINRVEYADGTIWQRKDWRFAEIGLAYKRAIATPWKAEMCRSL